MSFLVSESENPFKDWQSAEVPAFTYSPLQVDLQGIPEQAHTSVQERCFELYKKSQEILDQAIADTALEYVYQEGDCATAQKGPLLLLAEQMSERCLDLYQIQVDYDVSQGIPMLPVQAGQLKVFGFSSLEILQLQTTCQLCLDLLAKVPSEARLLLDAQKRRENQDPHLVDLIQAYEILPQKELLDRACVLMQRYGRYSLEAILSQLQAIARMKPLPNASLQERLHMEIRHRIAGDGTKLNQNPGWLGSNPLAYLNLLLKGDVKNWTAEFRNRMYFVYANIYLINAFAKDPDLLSFANQWLKDKEKGWQIDLHFVAAMQAREPKHLPPTLRYGTYAGLNPWIRESCFDPTFHERFPQPLIIDLVFQKAHADACFRGEPSERELMALTGDFFSSSVSPLKRLPFISGGAYFRLKKEEEIVGLSSQEKAAQSYAKMCRELRLPQLASISGTLDQIATVGGFIGATLSQEQLQELKLAMIAFMVPCRDHTVHEILQSAKTFGMAYEPGPQFLRFIAPALGERFIEKLERQMEKRNAPMPTFYLSAQAAQQIYQKGI